MDTQMPAECADHGTKHRFAQGEVCAFCHTTGRGDDDAGVERLKALCI